MPADRTPDPRVSEQRFHAMGSDAHVIVVGGPIGLAQAARRRIADLERRWSRFEADSEVSALTRHAGSPVVVSRETRLLVERAVAAWQLTRGLFDPTLLGAVLRAGYDRSFEKLVHPANSRPSALTTGTDAIEIVGDAVRLAAGTGFDPGGIGKGLAADIVTDELRVAGADGVCINLGGDVRVDGPNPSGHAWTISVDHPACAEPIARVGVERGAVATSTTLRREWIVDGERRHHLIDPATGRPSTSALTFVTVIAGQAWMAEVLAKATLLRGGTNPFDLLARTGGEAVAVDRDDRIAASPGIDAFLDAPLSDVIAIEVSRTSARAS